MGKRRGNGEGSVIKRKDGLWQASISLGYQDNGKPKRRTFYGKTRKEAVEKMEEAKQSLKQGTYVEPNKIALGDWIEKWLENYKKPNLKQSTYEGYHITAKTHIIPSLGKIPLSKLQANDLQKFYIDKLTKGRVSDGSGLTTQYVRHMHIIIRGALQQAVKENLIPRNVADATEPPAVKHDKVTFLTEEQLQQFLSEVKNDRLSSAFILEIATGLRRGELLGLCWDSVDLEKGIITIRRQLLSLKDGLKLEDTTKTKSGKRSIPIPANVLKELKSHKVRQSKEKLQAGELYQENGLVFCKEDGTPLEPRNFTKKFQRLLKQAGLAKVRLHDLRHSHASLLLKKGIHPKIVQERLGHSSITVTLDKYSHLVPGLQEKATGLINDLFDTKEKDSLPKGNSQ